MARKGAAARRLLQAAVSENPSHFYAHFDKAIRESFRGDRGRPSEPFARDYLELRSSLSSLRSTITWMWLLASTTALPATSQRRLVLAAL